MYVCIHFLQNHNQSSRSPAGSFEVMNFRTVSEEDANILEGFVNNFYEFEYKVDTNAESSLSPPSSSTATRRGIPFREVGPKITTSEIESDLVDGDINWIVLEDMNAEGDDILGCARMRVEKEKGISHIDQFAYCRSEDTEEGVIHRIRIVFIKHLETVAATLGLDVVCFEVPQHNEDMQTFLGQCGYEDARGRAMERSEIEKIKPIIPCMLLSYEKKLVKKIDDDEILEVQVVGDETTVFEKATSGPVFEGLMSDLFGALRTEYNAQKK